MRRVRALRDDLVAGTIRDIIGSLSSEQFIASNARLVGPDVVEAAGQRIRAGAIVIATGSRPIVPEPWRAFGDRILTTDALFELEDLPRRMAVIGLGAIGLELGQALARLGVEVTGFANKPQLSAIPDPVIAETARTLLGAEFPLHLGHTASIEEVPEGLRVSAGTHSVVVDKVLVCIGRQPNLDGLGLAEIGAPLDARGRPTLDPHTMQLGALPIYVAGDATGDLLIMHEAADEGRIAGFNAARQRVPYERKAPLAILFTDPNIVSVGAHLRDLDERTIAIGEVDFARQARARVMVKNRGKLRVYGDRGTGRLLGACLCAPAGEHLGHLLAWCIQQGLTVFDLQQMPYYHPVLEEGLRTAIDSLARSVEARSGSAIPHVRPAQG
jgi:dihydrolipoamide dehydrogenase